MKQFYGISICRICDKELIMRSPSQLVHTGKCRKIWDCSQRHHINKEKYPEYYALKKLIAEHNEIMKEKEKLELTIALLCHPIVRNRRERKLNVDEVLNYKERDIFL